MTLSGRAAYRDEVTELARSDVAIVCLEADLGGAAHPFAEAHPERFFNVGIAESAMVDMAAALARAGYKPFASTFAPFATLRAAESMKLALGYLHANVTIVAPYAGVAGAWFGTTHHCLEDLAMVQCLPGVTIAAPYGEEETRAVVRAAAFSERPCYVRLGRNEAFESLPFDGRVPPPVTWQGRGVASEACLVSVGEKGTQLCLRLHEAHPELAHAHLCYVDHEHLSIAVRELADCSDRLLVVEEHRPTGSVASTLALMLPDCEVWSMNAGRAWPSEGGTHDEILHALGFDAERLVHRVEAMKTRRPGRNSVPACVDDRRND